MIATSRTRVFALLGDPVGHSLSPVIQNAGFRAAGLDAVYVALRLSAPDIPVMIRALVAAGGGGNVTVPHKQVALSLDCPRSARVALLGAANLFGGGEGRVLLDNSDVDGILAALDGMGGAGGTWCVLGTGGSARAVVGAALERGARLAVRSRVPERAAAFARWAAEVGVASADPAECDVVINATPLGLHDTDPLPALPEDFPAAQMALDLTYRSSATTAWCRAFRDAGCRADDGREVLLQQGVASWRLWFPGVFPPVEVMRAARDGRMA